MIKQSLRILVSQCIILASLLSANLFADDPAPSVWTNLLDANLSQWEVFMGVPHSSVDVDWTSKSDSGTEGTPMGLNNDPLKVFTAKEINGENTLCITGEIYGGLTTLKEFENYHLSLQFKWGEQKWPPRKNTKRDSGLLIHCVGNHGPSDENPHGEWNTVEVFSLGQTTVFVINGKPNMVLERTEHRTSDGWKPLTKGKLQIQSEAAEIYYRDIKIRPLESFPESLESITQPFEGKVEWFERSDKTKSDFRDSIPIRHSPRVALT